MQLNILEKICIDYNGSIEINKLSLLNHSIDNLKAVSLREHLLLEVKSGLFGDEISFKYDFLQKIFYANMYLKIYY